MTCQRRVRLGKEIWSSDFWVRMECTTLVGESLFSKSNQQTIQTQTTNTMEFLPGKILATPIDVEAMQSARE